MKEFRVYDKINKKHLTGVYFICSHGGLYRSTLLTKVKNKNAVIEWRTNYVTHKGGQPIYEGDTVRGETESDGMCGGCTCAGVVSKTTDGQFIVGNSGTSLGELRFLTIEVRP